MKPSQALRRNPEQTPRCHDICPHGRSHELQIMQQCSHHREVAACSRTIIRAARLHRQPVLHLHIHPFRLINLVSAYVLAEALRTELTGWGVVCSLQKPGEASARGTLQCQGCQPGSTRKLPPAHEESIISKLTETRNIAPVFAHA